ncbi:MAG: M50 family metallopeptidase [Candidatus Kapabacteria bacterium]|nr:M50 family metallopeptidase [Candidatus Kapabacteria bacterium]
MNSTKYDWRTFSFLIGFSIVSFVIWRFPEGAYILYPFTILGTWFHEISHGLMALILGGNFLYLEIFSNGSGVAHFTGPLFLGAIGSALTASAGPLGPTISGSVFLIASVYNKRARLFLIFVSLFMTATCLIWIRSWIGFGIILLWSIVIFFIALRGSEKFAVRTLQILSIQAFLSLYQSIDYLFSAGGEIGDKRFLSDTAVMAESLFLPYWFWGGAILLFSAILIILSFKFAFFKKRDN